MSPTGAGRARPAWRLPLVLGVVGAALLLVARLVLAFAQTSYETALSHDCTSAGCTNLGPLSAQPEYVAGLVVAVLGLGLVVVAFGAYARNYRRAEGPA